MAEELSHIQSLPTLCPDLRQCGEIKQTANDFVVTEIPLYEPAGEGDHVYITIKRKEETTSQMLKEIAKVLDINPRDIGSAGRKDKWATTTQTISINLPHGDEQVIIDKISNALPYEIISFARHTNKLKMGHLIGNYFELTVKTEAKAHDLEPIRQKILSLGLPNFFGEQRYGFNEKNIKKGKALLLGEFKERKRNLRDLLHSAYQSYLFDCCLKERIKSGNYQKIILGDLAKGTERGGLFTVEDVDCDQVRFDNREICYTGSLPGYKIPPTKLNAAKIENELFIKEEITHDIFKKARLPGSRRMGLIWLDNLEMQDVDGGIIFKFKLPKGSYATNLLREFFIFSN